MEEEAEVLDWGNEEDETGHFQSESREDAEDAVSLGGDEDDAQDYTPYQSRPVQEPGASTQASTPQHYQPESLSQQSRHDSHSRRATESPKRSQSVSLGHLKHALPPKPVLTVPEYVRPAPPQASTLAGPMVRRERRSNGSTKGDNLPNDLADLPLPPNWEPRYPRNGSGRDVYYYNVETHESTWTRPEVANGVAPSPSKDIEQSAARSPRSITHDDSARPPLPDRTPSIRGRKSRRRVSPDTMTFDDRHYRPGEAETPGVVTDDDRGVPRSRARQPSLDALDDRRAQSPASAHRDADRTSYARRPYSRSPSPVQGTRRDAQHAPPSRSSPPLERERGWARGHPSTSTEVARSPSPNSHSQRGRRLRAEVSPLHHPHHTQDQNDRRVDPKDWPSAPHRFRSPSRDDTQSKSRRNWDSWEAPPSNKNNRPLSPPSPDRVPARIRDDVYIPSDSVPQRRRRDLVSPDRLGDVDVKRRRVDDRSSDVLSTRRPPAADHDIVPSASLSERPMSDLSLADEPRRKRIPLPPQSARFREASKMPPPAAPALPGSQSLPLSNGLSVSTSRPHIDSTPPKRPTTHSYADVPSGPRNTITQAAGRDQDSARLPSSRSSGRPSRFDPSIQPQQRSQGLANDDRVAMDVDYPPSSQTSIRPTEPPRAPVMYPSRPHDIPTGPPRAPKAMTGRFLPLDVPGPPATTSYSDIRTSAVPVNDVSLRGGRALPPHMSQAQDPWSRRETETLPPRPAVSVPDGSSRRYDEDRDFVSPTAPSRSPLEPIPRDARTLSGRDNFRPVDVAPPRGKLSGSNSTPVGPRRIPNGPPPDQPRASRSPVEKYRPLPEQDVLPRREYEKYPDEILPTRPSPRESPNSQYRPLPPTNDRRQSFPSSVSVQPVLETMPPPRRDNQSERSARQSRFGAEQKSVPPSDIPRIWLTREESERAERVRAAELAGMQSSNSRDISLSSRHALMDVDEPPRRYDAPSRTEFGGITPPRPAESSRRHDERPSLEGRLSLPQETPSRGHRNSDAYHESSGRRGSWDDERERSHDYHPASSHQDRSHPAEHPPPPMKVHPERMRLLTPQPADSPAPEPRSGRGSGRSRRQPPSRGEDRDSSQAGPQGNGYANGGDHYESDRPNLKRGASLLDRLSLDMPSGSSLSSSVRMDATAKRAEEVAGLPPKPVLMVSEDGDGGLGDGGKGGRNKRKSGKSRRGRRSGVV